MVPTLNKRKCCIEWCVENFLKFALVNNRRAYFWTFTTHDERTAKDMGAMWNHLLTLLREEYGKLDFIRVLEPHKSGTRFHLHCLFMVRMDVRVVRAIAEPLGWGRMQVCRVKDGDLADYLSK